MPTRWKKVLVVDDSRIYRELMTTLLRSHCDELVTADDVAQAVEQLDADASFDLVICDVVMRGDDGFALLEHLQERDGSRPPVVMVTGYRSEDGLSRAARLGAAGYLQKPTTVRQILGAVAHHGERRAHHPRWRCHGTAALIDPATGKAGPLYWDVYDITPGGAFLETKGPLPLGSELDLLVEILGRKTQVRARVVRVQEPTWLDVGGVGVEFLDPGEELELAIRGATVDWG